MELLGTSTTFGVERCEIIMVDCRNLQLFELLQEFSHLVSHTTLMILQVQTGGWNFLDEP